MKTLQIVAALLAASVWTIGCGDSNGGSDVDCLGDAVCEGCVDDPRAPWCYSDAAGDLEDPDMCDNITTYWGDEAATVEAYCVYEIARATKNCSLCSRIQDSNVKSICNDDCQ